MPPNLTNGSHVVADLAHINAVTAEASTNLSHDPLSLEELNRIWEWNSEVPEQVSECVHDLITEHARHQPDAQAVCSWDGNFSYRELEILANEAAQKLIALGCAPKSVVPILFSKSKWTCVAMLGGIKAGGSVIALDATQPDARLQSILQQASPSLIVSSNEHQIRASRLAGVPVLTLNDELLNALSQIDYKAPQLPAVSPSDIVYISFTSGTTGQPKGACISHANVRSAVKYQGKQLGFHHDSRVFDFAPYSFDVAWSNFLHTLCAGGCLCIASEEDMLSDLYSAITALKATLINITPTVLRTLTRVPPELSTVLLSGEMPYQENITQWAGKVRLLNTYGPTECTFKCGFSVLSPTQQGRPAIGRGVGFSTWIVDTQDELNLAPIGSIGELYLEGPLVGQGYLSDPAKTSEAFIDDPPWLLAGSSRISGRRGKLYKTGDLVKYREDGTMLFVGRKNDAQLKIRGQRVEVGDVEHHVRVALEKTPPAIPVIADVIRPQGSDSDTLTLFLVTKDQEGTRVKAVLDGLSEKLEAVLPTFMIPSVYLPIDEIPVASTGKVNRRKLREWGSSMKWEEVVALQSTILSRSEFSEPSNDQERQLRKIWSQVLGLELNHISTADNFFRLGGDSIAAIKVAAAARAQNLPVAVTDLFRSPTLRDLAQVAQSGQITQELEIPRFALLAGTDNYSDLCKTAAQLCGVEVSEIEDIYPCTPLQQGMLAMSAMNTWTPSGIQQLPRGAEFVSRTAYRLPQEVDIQRFQKAWTRTVQHAFILRTRIVDLPGEGLVQVVLNHSISVTRHSHIDDFVQQASPMGLGTSLCRAAIISGSQESLVLEMHHAIFDGWSTNLILDAMEGFYHDSLSSTQPLTPFQPFIKFVLDTKSPKAAVFWKQQLEDSEATVFPSADYIPAKKQDVNHSVSGLKWPQSGITPSTMVRSALSLLLSFKTNSLDVKFGATVSGRSAPISGIERIAAPTIATVPVRVKYDWSQTVQEFLGAVHQHAIEASDHEQFGLQNIQRIDEATKEASQFQLLLVIQPARQRRIQDNEGLFSQPLSVIENGTAHDGLDGSKTILVTKDGAADSVGMHNSYAMMIICQLEEDGLSLKVNFDSGAVDKKTVELFSTQFEHLIRQLCTETYASSKLSEIPVLSKEDESKIRSWNKTIPSPVEEPVTSMIDATAKTRPEAIAISSWDGDWTYQQVRELTDSLARCLQQEKGVGAGSIVVLSFEKSSWLLISMLAVLKAGAVALPVSAPTSTQRAREIVEVVKPFLVLKSDAPEPSSFDDLASTCSISALVQLSKGKEYAPESILVNESSDPALIVCTSGSTGVPKSILWSHGILSTNIQTHATSFGVNSSSRVFQFAGYDFDVSTLEALSTLSVGGCLCVPSDSDRTDRLARAIHESSANWLCLTPSVADTLNQRDVPSVRTLVLAGEKLSHKAAFRWASSLDSVFNWYGPAEASLATSYLVDKSTWVPGMSGKSTAGLTWLVNPWNHNSLAPVGAVAELCIEGPIVASYTGETGKLLNEQSFFRPLWLSNDGEIPGQDRQLYRTGDLVKYDVDGNIIFIGRKQDGERKLRGQRINLEEVEARAHSFLLEQFSCALVAEIFPLAGSSAETLALFVCATSDSGEVDSTEFLKNKFPVEKLEAHLLEFMPSFMIPKVYIPIKKIPTSQTGKTDRRQLRQIGSSYTQEQLLALQPFREEAKKPSTPMELRLQQLWAQTLSIEPQSIYANHNFFRLGGDSIAAMRLVALAHRHGLSLPVKVVFESPQLNEMADKVKEDVDAVQEEVAPFSLLGQGSSPDEVRSHAARMCGVRESEIVDIYPCTALQQGLLALGVRRKGRYVSRSVLGLQPEIDVAQLERAWEALVEKIPLLRTRIVDIPGQGFMQVVLGSTPLLSGSDVNDYVRKDEQDVMGPGTELCRAAIIDRSFILTIHHCTYDGNTLRMLLSEFESQYLGDQGLTVTPYKNFIRHIGRTPSQEAAEFWKKQLSDLEARQFPVLPSTNYVPKADGEINHAISVDWPRIGVTPSTILRSAWAILATQYTLSNDVMFALTVSGRQADMNGIDNCVGPTISTMPMAISVNWDETIGDFMNRMQREMVQRTPYEQYGLQNIQRPHGELDPRLLQTIFVVQPVATGPSLDKDGLLFKARSFSSNINTLGTDPFNNYALMVVCELGTSGFNLRMSFDSDVIDQKQMGRMARQFETVIQQLCSESLGSSKLDTVQTASSDDLVLFWAQNAQLPPDPPALVPDMVRRAAEEQPDKVAIDAWDGQLTCRQVDEFSTTIAKSLLHLGVAKGSVVALHFEKSKWVPVMQLAVFKAGAVEVQLSVSVPDLRVARVFANLDVKFSIASETLLPVVSRFARGFTVKQLLELPLGDATISLPALQAHDSAAILVSSGSTGEPKQVLWSHKGIAANIKAHGDFLCITPSSRIFQFASYDFDVSTIESMSALSHQACLCIPSESERLNEMSATINRYQTNFVNITPSTAKAVQPDDVPCIRTIVLSGENLVQEDVDRWKGKCQVLNWYGAAEHPSTVCPADADTWHSGVIGSLDSEQPTLSWLVDIRNHNRLVPYGAVGEIASEGPLSSDGYVANPTLNERRFRKDPVFLSAGSGTGIQGRKGEIFCSGDLGQYDSIGNLVYVGRKDAQVKIRGQLVAPEEVQYQIRKNMESDKNIAVIVDAIRPRSGANLTLVAFLNVETEAEVEELTNGLDEKLKRVLPPYAIPVYYIPVKTFPKNASAKTDRAKLREIGASFDPARQASASQSLRRAPSTAMEKTLLQLWCRVLGASADSISVTDSFLQLADSIQAMRLVGIARQEGLLLTVAGVFEHPILEDMAKIVEQLNRESEETTIAPFSLLGSNQDIELARQHAANACGVKKEDIEDLFPCTPLQEGLLALTMKRDGDYIGNTILELSPSTDIVRLKEAWEKVVVAIQILRTRILDIPGHGLFQAVIKGENNYTEAGSIAEYLKKQSDSPMGLGSSLMRWGLFRDATVATSSTPQTEHHEEADKDLAGASTFMLRSGGKPQNRSTKPYYFAMTLHHSIYDGLTTPLILETLESYYNDAPPESHCPFQSFIKYIEDRDRVAESRFWKTQFHGLKAPQFPALPVSTYEPQTNETLIYSIDNLTWRGDDITPSTVVRGALALLCLQHTGSSDVVFGEVTSGRKVPMGGVERLVGPTIATVPIRVKVDSESSSSSFLAALQKQATQMIPFEQTGLSRIRQLGDEAYSACRFQTLLVVQMPEEDKAPQDNNLFVGEVRRCGAEDDARYHGFQTYALSFICTPEAGKLEVRLCFDSTVIGHEAVQRMSEDFEHLVRRVNSQELDGSPVGEIVSTRDQDLNQIWRWNSALPQSIDRCVHDLISEVAQAKPDATAISAWDGTLSYGLLDRLSAKVALHLQGLGLQQGATVPICFEKSVYFVVAFLGVVKAGASGFPIDNSLPGDSTKSLLEPLNISLAISSPPMEAFASTLAANVLVLGPESELLRPSEVENVSLGDIPALDPASAFFTGLTSGSSGQPKTYVLQHRNFTSAVFHQQRTLLLGENTILYNHAPQASHVSSWSAFQVLAAGGTLCIPSQVEQGKDLEEGIRRFGATHVVLAPSVSRQVDPLAVPTLKTVYLGGEQITEHDVARWVPHVNTFVTYGVAECSTIALYERVTRASSWKPSIGPAVGACAWILDPQNRDRLVPIGTAGELYLEGPLVAPGYVNDETSTTASFLDSPKWLLDGSPDGRVAGRGSRLFKTGDIVKYNPSNGALIFVGRRDGQAVVQGHRIDLAEVEHHVRDYFAKTLVPSAVVAEVAVPTAIGRPVLVAFVQSDSTEVVNGQSQRIEAALLEQLPAYMIPSAYIPVDTVPLLRSGKIDRARFREMASNLTMDHLASTQSQSDENKPVAESEVRLTKLWATILQVPEGNIRTDSSFIRLGGDSISAMRLTSLARTEGISLTVQQILQNPRLSNMAQTMTSSAVENGDIDTEVVPFELLKDQANRAAAIDYVTKYCSVDASLVEDIFPCTSVQKSLLSMTAKSDNSYVARYSLQLAPDVDLDRLKAAWETVSRDVAPILRSRIVDIPSEGLVHVQLNEPIQWDSYEDVDTYFERDERKPMGLGTPLTRLAIVKKAETGRLWCFITQHHAIYDGYSVGLLLQEVLKAYAGIVDTTPVAPFQAFMKHVGGVGREEASEFWRQQFLGSEAVPFPALPSQDYRPNANSTVKFNVADIEWRKQDATASTLIRAAWSILTSHYTRSDDVLFGAMVSGRQAPLDGIERMIAPLISAVPIRVKFDPSQSVGDLLDNIQGQSLAMIPFEQTELLDIRRVSAETDLGTRFNTLLVVNPPEQNDYMDQGPFQHQPGYVSNRNGLDDFNPNAVMIMCQLTKTNDLQVEISFDSHIIDDKQMERIAAQFEHILRQINASSTQSVDQVAAASERDVAELWKWNSTVPQAVSACVHHLIGETTRRQPNAPAICAWDGSLSYAELDRLSNRVATYLVSQGAKQGEIIPLCFEKSMWHPVAALGIMKTGAACLAMDSTQPESRLGSIIRQVDPKLILSSASNEGLATSLSGAKVVVVGEGRFSDSLMDLTENPLPEVTPSDTLYVVFTSGSTGLPKGIITTHENFASAATHQADILHIKSGTRVFDFVSYSFDVSWSNHLQTLIRGGCLCIPSEQDRRNDIAGAFNRMNCDYSYFTPSVAQTLEPSQVPGLKTLAMGGEPIPAKEVARWTQTEQVIGIYGPAECAQALSFTLLDSKTPAGHVGVSYGARTWLVEPGRPDRLAAIGTIAELMIEGPTVSKGYFGDLNRTTQTYIQDPGWLSSAPAEHQGRKGRLYMTGDLLRYRSDGSLDFIGRKDGMIKLRGQRIELEEVEYHVRASLRDPDACDGIAAEIIRPQNNQTPLLALFFSLSKRKGVTSAEDAEARAMQILEGLEEKLWDRLPQYMVPGAYIRVDEIPMTTTNKTDRRALRELGSTLTLEKLAELQSRGKERRAPSTPMEKKLQALWSSVLELDSDSIGADTSFLRVGGESIAAMRLVSKAREQGLSLTVGDIFRAPRLSDQALLVTETIGDDNVLSHTPFALLNQENPADFLKTFVEPLLDPGCGTIKDVIPATDFQTLSVLQALQDPPSRYPHFIFDLPVDVNFSRLKTACTNLVQYFEILHTVFIQLDSRFWQVLLDDFSPAYDELDALDEDIADFTNSVCAEDLKRPRNLGRSFIHFVAIKHQSGAHKLVFRISHAQFDGFSWATVLETLSSLYSEEPLPRIPGFSHYIAFNETRKTESIQYWASRLEGSSYPGWTTTDSSDRAYSAASRLTMSESIPVPKALQNDGVSMATLFHAACAIALSRQFNQAEVVLGRLVTGRSMLPADLQNIVGPTMTEVPVRVTVSESDDLRSIALQLQSRFIEDARYEAVGMDEIISNCTDWVGSARDFGWRTSFQQAEDAEFTFLGSPSKVGFFKRDMPPRSRPEVYATPKDGNLEIEVEGNVELVSRDTVAEFLAQLRGVLMS